MATRRERVVLDLQDNFTPGMARAAAATALLNRELNSLSGQSLATARSSQTFVRDVDNIGRAAKGADGSINQLTGRLRVLAEVAAVLGPSLTPIGGVAVAGIGGLANQMGIAAVAGGVLIGSLQGVGDALGAMNKAQLEPTEKNLQAARDALEALSPAAEEFARQAFALKPALVALRDIGAEALMPGLTESLDSLEDLGPRVGAIMESFGTVLGDIASDSTASLASDRWADFFRFIETEGPATMSALATTVGDVAHGFSELWEAFAPLNSDFNDWLLGAANGFDEWATGLSATAGFTEFIDYIRTTGPQVADTFAAMFDAVVQLVQATAPLGGPVLAGIEAAAKAFSAIADSDLGTPILAGVAALSLLNRTLAVTASLSKVSLGSGLFAGVGTLSKGVKGQSQSIRADLKDATDGMVAFGANADKAAAAADRLKGRIATGAGLAGMGVLATGAADGIGLTNTASLALMGTMMAPGWGTAVGGAAGLFLDWRASIGQADEQLRQLEATVSSMSIDELTSGIADAEAKLAAFGSDSMAGELIAGQLDVAKDALQELTQAEGVANAEARGAALAFLAQTEANVDLGKWSGKSTEAIKAQADAILETREEANKTAESFVGLGESLNDSKVSLGQWIRNMASTADALNNFTTNSQRAAKRGLEDGLIRQLQAAGKEGALRMRQLANGTESEIGRANAAFRKGEQAIERYNNYKVPPKKVTADVSQAMSGFLGVDRYLASLDGKTATTYVNTVRTVTGPQGAAVFGQRADGGTIDGPRQPYGDKMLYLLAPGEEVISNRHGQADRHRPLLKAINGGLADGGTAGKKKPKHHGGATEDAESDAERRRREQREREQAEAAERYYSAQERAQREAEQRAEHESKMFLAAIEGQERAAQGLIDAAETQKQSAEAVRDGWAQAMERAGAAATSGFRSDLFGSQQHGLWSGKGGGSGSSWMDALLGDIAGLQERQGLISQLSAQGVTGSALEALLGQGSNSDITSLIGSGQASQFAALFAQREALQGSVSAQAGQAAYGAEYAMASAQVAALGNQLLLLQQQLAAISAQRPITVYEAYSAQATAAEVARLQSMQGAA